MDIVERLRNGCTCNFESTPCGAEEECRNAFDGADQIVRLREALLDAAGFVSRADTIEQLRKQVDFERKCREDTYADLEKQDAEIERLRGVLLTVLEACKDVNSPDQKVRKEITRTVRKALKEEK